MLRRIMYLDVNMLDNKLIFNIKTNSLMIQTSNFVHINYILGYFNMIIVS